MTLPQTHLAGRWRASAPALATPGLIAIALLATSCGGSAIDGPAARARGPAVRIISGAGVSDTVDAAPAAPLVVEVIDSAGAAMANALVLLTAPPLPAPVACTGPFACHPVAGVYTSTNLRTDAQGRVSVPIGFGAVAGAARIVIAAPTLGVQVTAQYTILPGRAARTTIAPHDTCVYFGTTTPLRVGVMDRYGNPRPEVPALVAPAATPVVGTSVSAAAYGVAVVTAQSSGAIADTARVAVVPRGTIAALAGYLPSGPDTLVVFDLDGTPRARLSADGVVNGITWSPDGSRVVFARLDASNYRLYATTLTGTPAPLLQTRTPSDQERPAFSHDGRWLFYGEADYATYSFRLWRANADGTGAQQIGATAGGSSGLVGTTLGPSADGSRVAYFARRDCCSNGSLNVMDVASGTVTQFAGELGAPRWSPRDDLIAYSAAIGQGVVSPAGTPVQQFAGTSYIGFADHTIDWSPDARWLVVRNTDALELVDVTSGARVPLPYTANFYQPAWKP